MTITRTLETLPHTFETAQLRMRRPTRSDAPALVERWASDAEATRYVAFPTYSPGDFALAEGFLDMCVANWGAGTGHRPWVLCERGGDDQPIGMFGITPGHDTHAYEIGYVLGRPWHGRGMVTEAVAAAVAQLFAVAQVWRVFAPTHVDNLASQRVLAKCGFKREGVLRRHLVFPNLTPEPQDCAIWSVTRDDLA